ncbi:DNA topoisomerase IV, alpha subunit [Westerdykella ornata]|uniref:DNA topoisomerase (ATP-hydrolyzing) n=1 Tax=Westerdykella ornata TaxID=318751 RepID=A0A6A6JKT6_WESOR|nr:DNA topoisomerase IV, alpha subunit [Westerdykella ornata]KAF2276558.1 DNA topoisomerase IV, alpha subunit [Westerdykella ornata]
MQPHEMEDMLFSFPSSQESQDGVDDESDLLDELPGEEYDSDIDLWEEENTQNLLLPPTPDASLDEDILDEFENAVQLADEIQGTTTGTVKNRDWVIARVEGLIEGILDGLLAGDSELSISLKTRSGISRRDSFQSKQTERAPHPRTRKISFPGSNGQEAWRFTVLVKILQLVHECLIEDVVASKRDLYYRHPDLFVKQSVVDRFVDDLACTLGIPRALLNVTAAAKGLVAGNFTLVRADGTIIHGLNVNEGMLLPNVNSSDTLDISSVQWVIIVEKEATFRHLAKGYPDVSTRTFLQHIADRSPEVRMFAVVDYDPDGIAIMSTYKYGSHRLAHENKTNDDTGGPNLRNLHWLGVHSHHLFRIPQEECAPAITANPNAQGLLRLSPRDRTKACRMLEWDLCTEDGPETDWRRQLQRMLMLNIKAEIQILEESSDGLVAWLEEEIGARDFGKQP